MDQLMKERIAQYRTGVGLEIARDDLTDIPFAVKSYNIELMNEDDLVKTRAGIKEAIAELEAQVAILKNGLHAFDDFISDVSKASVPRQSNGKSVPSSSREKDTQ